jgi:Chaperone of endosialidase
MGKSSPSAPAAPDPNVTSAAQTASNKATALYNFGLNNPNVTTPLGSNTFQSNGVDANGTPIYNENISLSPAEQQIFDQSTANVQQQGANAQTAQGNVTNLLQTPYNLQGNVSPTLSQQNMQGDLQNAENSLYHQQTQYLDPQFQQGQDQLQSQLQNQGLAPGSAAYNTAMQNFGLQKQQAYQSAQNQATSGGAAYQAQLSQTALANQAQQAQLYTQQYQEPLNLYSSLMSGTQPNMPQFQGTNTSQAAPTNVLGAYNSAYQGQLNAYNAQVGSANSANSGMFQLGGAALSAAAMMSDRRLKKNIKALGTYLKGIPLYEFEYLWSKAKYIGVMADEVKKVMPQAVIRHESGFDMVNYGMLL